MSEMPGFPNNFRNNILGGGQGLKWTLFFGFAYTIKLYKLPNYQKKKNRSEYFPFAKLNICPSKTIWIRDLNDFIIWLPD